MVAWPFDRTYEGLKPSLVATPRRVSPAFDRTYEGLKLRKIAERVNKERLLTVPMRV